MPCLVDLRPDTVVDLTVLRPFLPSADALDKPDDNLEPKPEDFLLIFSVRDGRREVVYSEEEGAGGFLSSGFFDLRLDVNLPNMIQHNSIVNRYKILSLRY